MVNHNIPVIPTPRSNPTSLLGRSPAVCRLRSSRLVLFNLGVGIILMLLSLLFPKLGLAENSKLDEIIIEELKSNNALISNDNEVEVSVDLANRYSSLTDIKVSKFNFDKRTKKFSLLVNDYTRISGKFIEYVSLPVLNNTLHKAHIISDEDIDYVKFPIEKIRKNTIREKNALLGKSPKNNILAFNMISEEELTNPKVIFKGDQVNLEYIKGQIVLKTTATAMDNGAIGEVIRVKNTRSNVIIQGQVVDKSLVKVGAGE